MIASYRLIFIRAALLCAFILCAPRAEAGIGGLIGLFTEAHGSNIIDVSCFDTLSDSDPRSCEAQKARPEDVRVRVKNVAFKGWIGLNETKKIGGVNYSFWQIGDIGCVYQVILWPKTVARTEELDHSYNNPMQPKTDIGKLFDNCVSLPNPDRTATKDNWPKFAKYVSDACVYGCADANGDPTCSVYQAMTMDKQYREFFPPMFSVGIHCIEETLLRIFDANSEDGAFQRMSEFLRPLVLALMALSICLTGMKFAGVFFNPSNASLRQKDFMWMIMKLVLVAVFSVGANMAFFFDAARIAQTTLISLVFDLQQGTLSLAQQLKDNEKFVPEAVSDEYDEDVAGAAFDVKDYDYDFCGFTEGFDYSNFTYTDINGAPMPYTGKLARYWDMLDCRFAQYMGTGWYTMEQSSGEMTTDVNMLLNTKRIRKVQAPINIIYSLYLYLVPGIGWLIAAMAIVYVVFLFLLFGRFFMLYLSYVLGLCLLFLFAPLFVASSLFDATGKMFSVWRKYIISAVLHPIFFFLFLILFLMMLDRVYFGGNHKFVGFDNKGECASIGKKGTLYDPNKIMMTQVGKDCVCDDNNTLPCIYGQKAYVKRHKQQLGILLSFDFYMLSLSGINFGQVFLIFGRLFVLFYASYYILQYVERMANAITGGIDALAGNINVKNPLQMLKKTAGLAVAVGAGAILAIAALPLMAAGGAAALGNVAGRAGSMLGRQIGKQGGKFLSNIGKNSKMARRAIDALKRLRSDSNDKNKNNNNTGNASRNTGQNYNTGSGSSGNSSSSGSSDDGSSSGGSSSSGSS